MTVPLRVRLPGRDGSAYGDTIVPVRVRERETVEPPEMVHTSSRSRPRRRDHFRRCDLRAGSRAVAGRAALRAGRAPVCKRAFRRGCVVGDDGSGPDANHVRSPLRELPAAMALVSGTRALFVGPVPGGRQREGLDRCDGRVAGVKPTDADEEFLYLRDGAGTHACQSLDPVVDGRLE